MSGQGWIKLHRQLQDCWIWKEDEKFTYGQAWVDLLLFANHLDNKILFDNEFIVVRRGQHLTSIRKLADRWNWSREKVVRFLDLLKRDGMITRNSDNRKTVITIQNYEQYQGFQDDDCKNAQPQKSHCTATVKPLSDQLHSTNNNENNVNNDNNITMCNQEHLELFEYLWKLYPLKKGKSRVSDETKLMLFEIGKNEMERAIERYRLNLAKDSDWRKPQNGSTFFNSGYIDYLDNNYVPYKKDNLQKNKFGNFEKSDYNFMELEKKILEN